MAVYPTPGGSEGTWGAECSAYHAVSTDLATGKIKDGAVFQTSAAPTVDAGVANKLYVDNGGSRLVGGVATVVHTKYLTGSQSGTTKTIAHGIADHNKILSVAAILRIEDEASGSPEDHSYSVSNTDRFLTTFSTSDVILTAANPYDGTTKYSIKIDYID
jgi:hypothetical protein